MQLSRPLRGVLPAMALTFVLTATTPAISAGDSRGDGANLQGLVREFNAICSELQKARGELQLRVLDEREFGDQILALFVRADSIHTLLEQKPQCGTKIALGWALKHLTDSLRENYEGIVEGNGYRFVTADLAFKAAEAWKGSLGDVPVTVP